MTTQSDIKKLAEQMADISCEIPFDDPYSMTLSKFSTFKPF